MTSINDVKIRAFQKKIFDWWLDNRRDLPWRSTTNPYYIMISEIMLQQTQVPRTIEKYLEFIEMFPNLELLAKASIADVLTIWSGLGYNRRALWLQQAAQQLITMKNFPQEPEELEKLKGIGPYTARAILIFAFNKDLPTVDTNIRRILIAEGFATEETSDKELFDIAELVLPKGHSRDWHNALMDYGSLVLTASKTGIKPKTIQKKFNRSTRYYRGQIVKQLTKKSKVSKKELISLLEIPKKDIQKILDDLEKDGLVKRIDEYYSLP
ncbi:MAG: Fe-S cluster assembly protein HesB [Asgard group archaeon]|nr:Fe-S cluster assembly protein HesB [Asgard group archaeon]